MVWRVFMWYWDRYYFEKPVATMKTLIVVAGMV